MNGSQKPGRRIVRFAGHSHHSFRDLGHVCSKFSAVEIGASPHINPLAEIWLFTPRDASDAHDVADVTVRSGEGNPQERSWHDAAASMIWYGISNVIGDAAIYGEVGALYSGM
jgi:hypothetical protein